MKNLILLTLLFSSFILLLTHSSQAGELCHSSFRHSTGLKVFNEQHVVVKSIFPQNNFEILNLSKLELRQTRKIHGYHSWRQAKNLPYILVLNNGTGVSISYQGHFSVERLQIDEKQIITPLSADGLSHQSRISGISTEVLSATTDGKMVAILFKNGLVKYYAATSKDSLSKEVSTLGKVALSEGRTSITSFNNVFQSVDEAHNHFIHQALSPDYAFFTQTTKEQDGFYIYVFPTDLNKPQVKFKIFNPQNHSLQNLYMDKNILFGEFIQNASGEAFSLHKKSKYIKLLDVNNLQVLGR